jgi:hypothetical protein
VGAVRENLVAHEYVFLPLGQGADAGTGDDDPGIALAHVVERDAARSLELWGRKIEFKRVLFEHFVRDYAGWKAAMLHQDPPVRQPGRFSGSTVYIDQEMLKHLAQSPKPPYATLGIDGLIREVELRSAAHLLFVRDVTRAATKDPSELQRAMVEIEERVLWTAIRYGDPDVALADVVGLASGTAAPPALREAAARVLAALPPGTRELPSKSKRAEALHTAADEAWPRIPGRS